jgi:predicted PurR-regulated permease PerM
MSADAAGATPKRPVTDRTPLPSARTVIAAVAVIALLYVGREFMVPVALAVVFSALARPIVRVLERRRLPTALAATIVVLLTLVLVSAGVIALAAPVQEWARRVPESVSAAQAKLARIRRPVEQLTKAATQLQHPDQGGAPAQPGAPPGTPGQAPQAPAAAPSPGAPSVIAKALGTTTSLVMGGVEVLLLAWLLLASGDLFLEKLLKLLPLPGDRRTAVQVVSETEAAVAHYIAMTALINVGQAAAVGIAMWLLGMPSPVLWGLLTLALEFIPYLGGAVMVGLLSIVAFTTFDRLGHALAVPGAYLAISTLQNNLVSPLVYGRRLKLNPVAVLVGVMFWWSLWGVAGAFLAVPIIATAKVLGDHIPAIRPLGEFLGA